MSSFPTTLNTVLDSQPKQWFSTLTTLEFHMPPSSSPEMLVIDLGQPGHQYFIVPQKTLMCSLDVSAGPEERH